MLRSATFWVSNLVSPVLILTSSGSILPICCLLNIPLKLGLDKGAIWHYPSFCSGLMILRHPF